MKVQMPLLAQLEKENEQKKKQLIHLARRIDGIGEEMGTQKELSRKLKIMVNLETDEDEAYGLGGPAPIFSDNQDPNVKDDKELARLMHRSLDSLENEIAVGEKEKTNLYEFFENQKMLLASTPSIRPANGWMSSRLGHRRSPFTGKREMHRGIDIAKYNNTIIFNRFNFFIMNSLFVNRINFLFISVKLIILSNIYKQVHFFEHISEPILANHNQRFAIKFVFQPNFAVTGN